MWKKYHKRYEKGDPGISKVRMFGPNDSFFEALKKYDKAIKIMKDPMTWCPNVARDIFKI